MVMWAQRPNLIFLTVCVEDCKDPVIKVEPNKLYFKGIGGPEKKVHELSIDFFGEIDPEVSKIFIYITYLQKLLLANSILCNAFELNSYCTGPCDCK